MSPLLIVMRLLAKLRYEFAQRLPVRCDVTPVGVQNAINLLMYIRVVDEIQLFYINPLYT